MIRRTGFFAALSLLILLSLNLSMPTFANPIAPENAESVALNTTYTLTPVADAHVNQAYPTTNYGTSAELREDGSPVKRAYLRFTVAGLTSGVSKATLRLFANSSLSTGITVDRVADNTWGETTITYGNAPALGSAIGTTGAVTLGTWVSMDVTSYVTGNGTFSFALTSGNSTALSLASREATNKPQLVITTGTAINTATATATKSAPTATRTPTTTAPTATRSATTAPPPPTATATPSGSRTCNFTIPASTTLADGRGNYSAVQPGNTVCLAAGNRPSLKLINFKGTASAPITFINSGGKVVISGVNTGIQLYGSQHVRISGTGDPAIMYGIEVGNASNAGVETNHPGTSSKLDGTEYVEFDHIYAHDVRAGFLTAKNDDLMDTGIVWSGHQFYIHDNYIKTTDAEGMYIGTSDTHGVFPIYDVQVWNNRIEDAGFDGIQIRQAHTRVLVHDNFINGTGRDPCKNGSLDNTAGFNIAKGTDTGDWYNNTIIGARTAFFIKDSSNVRAYNNLVVNSGHATSGLTDPDCPAGVTSTPPEGAVRIINASNIQYLFNTVVNTSVNAAYGISISSSTGTIHDNIVGGTFNNLITGSGMTLTNNLISKDVGVFNFVNPTGGDYHLTSSSPAVNIASESTFPTLDMDRSARPQGIKSDVGGYEYH